MTGSSPGPVTRREFLVLGGGAAAGAGLAGCGWPFPGSDPVTGTAAAVSGGYPRVLAFRQSEVLARLRSYSDWASVFGQFSGIIGKAVQEERTDFSGPETVDYFTRFKQQFPDKLVLLHLNGRGRRPTFETDGWSAGWWLYRAGSVLRSAAGPQDTELRVASTNPFRLTPDRRGERGDDLVIAAIGADGRPDFSTAEQVRLSEINKSDRSVTVQRGRYGTSPQSFPSGAYVAPHVYAGPWSDVDDRVWLYNLATTCPPDAAGRRLLDVLLEQFETWFAPDGILAAFDGLQLDVFQLRLSSRGAVDADCDGEVDMALQDGVDTYLQGQVALTTGLRQILGPQRYLITDGGVGQQPDTASVNGVELEGFPTLDDYDMRLWSQALMTLEFWRRRGVQDRLSYPLFKFSPPNDYPVSFNRFRLTLAAALIASSTVSWYNEPQGSSTVGGDLGVDPGEVRSGVVVWDEFVAGGAARSGWLGAPSGDAIHLAERTADLLEGAGVGWFPALVDTFTGPNVAFSVQPPTGDPILLVSSQRPQASMSFTFPSRTLTGRDVVLALDLRADPRADYPGTIGRKCTVTVLGSGEDGERAQTLTVPTGWFHAVLGFHDIGPGSIQVLISIEGDEPLKLRGLRMFAAPDAIVRRFRNGAVFANPSSHRVTFDVARLFPGRRFGRIQGNVNQDPDTNDGTPLGSRLTLGPLDALLVREI